MAWDHLSINKPHLVYIILGGFTTLFMLCSSIIKERLYIGEATVATICGIIFGPHAADLINPLTWGNTDQITLEFSRIVLVVQCFAVGVELPKNYMERHWRSVVFLLVPVMTFGYLITSLFIWGLFNAHLNWLDSLCIAACVTATDPVLASSVVGKGKFAKRVPKHLRDLLSCESGCNDGMAFPFVYLAIYIIRYKHEPNEVALEWFCVSILYECVFGALYGVTIGYIARRLVRIAHERDYIDRESFLVFYFVLALFCAGSGSLLGMDDLLVGFACGVGFSNDGWFTEKTEESHVSNVIDLLINLAFFVYFGTIVPWRSYNAGYLGLDVWRLVVLAFLVLFFRRIPIMMALKPIIPDVKTWREALFAGHFGPIGVGAIFVAILARAELETGETTPLAVLPPPGFPHDNIIELIWPITTFLVITSIIVHGSSIAVFTLGKHINTLTLTMSYSKAVDEPNWMDRLPRIQSRSKSQMSMQRSDSDVDEKTGLPTGLLPVAAAGNFLRRQREEDNPSRAPSRSSSRQRTKHHRNREHGRGSGGPVTESAIRPQSRLAGPESEQQERSDSDTLAVTNDSLPSSQEKTEGPERDSSPDETGDAGEIFEEGDQTVFEDGQGNVLATEHSHPEDDPAAREAWEIKEGRRLMRRASADEHGGVAASHDDEIPAGEKLLHKVTSAGSEILGKSESREDKQQAPERSGNRWRQGFNKVSAMGAMGITGRENQSEKKQEKKSEMKHAPARAYQFGNTIIVEDEDGEVIKKYDIPAPDKKGGASSSQNASHRVGQMGKILGLGRRNDKAEADAPAPDGNTTASPHQAPTKAKRPSLAQPTVDDDDDDILRFTAGGRRMSKAEFIDQIRDMDPKRRVQAVENSNAPEPVKREARKEAREQAGLKRNNTASDVPVVPEDPAREEKAEAESQPQIQRTTSHDSHSSLRLIDSSGQEVPFHDVSSDLRNRNVRGAGNRSQGQGQETAAARRRRLATSAAAAVEEDSDDDGTERVPPTVGPSSSAHDAERQLSTSDETAAERRRRMGALHGTAATGEHSSSSESEAEQQAPQNRGIRFADQAPGAAAATGSANTSATTTTTNRGTGRLRWGKDVRR